jgi:hypothetical protein
VSFMFLERVNEERRSVLYKVFPKACMELGIGIGEDDEERREQLANLILAIAQREAESPPHSSSRRASDAAARLPGDGRQRSNLSHRRCPDAAFDALSRLTLSATWSSGEMRNLAP